jgi:hypothetical protein
VTKPGLITDLRETDDKVFVLIGKACLLLTGVMLEHFLDDMRVALQPNAVVGYEEILAIIDQYVSLEDSSGTNPNYSPFPGEEE